MQEYFVNIMSFSNESFLLNFILLYLGIFFGVFLHIVVHEAGHLVFGLLTGYRFSSFRIGSFMLFKSGNRWKMKRMSIPGTGGQCLMEPPEIKNGKMPFVWYNLGGSIFNLLLSIGLILIALWSEGFLFIRVLLITVGLIGIYFACVNGIPLKITGLYNDGKNLLFIKESEEALKAFWIQLQVSKEQNLGKRICEMPKEWFYIPQKESMKNPMITSIGIFTYSRFLEEGNYEKAQDLLEDLVDPAIAMNGLYRNLLKCDYIFIELMGENRIDKLNMLYTEDFKKYMKQIKNFPSVIRLEYAFALLREGDLEKANKLEKQFEKRAKTYPYQGDIEVEKQLMALCKERFLNPPLAEQ